jgi:hypothetical protein
MNEQINLDDLTFADLVDEARALIPTIAPDWTDHNPSDPGIVLVELFAWLVEMVQYRMNRISEANYRVFLSLLNGPDTSTTTDPIDVAIRKTLADLRDTFRAITQADFEYLVLHKLTLPGAPILRIRYLPDQDLTASPPLAALGHVSIVVLPADVLSNSNPLDPTISSLQNLLEPRRLVTNLVHLVPPRRATVNVTAKLYLRPDAVKKTVQDNAGKAIAALLHPFIGGDGHGWPFNRNLYPSDIFSQLALVDGVDGVRSVTLASAQAPAADGGGLNLSGFEVITADVADPAVAEAAFTTFVQDGIVWVSV